MILPVAALNRYFSRKLQTSEIVSVLEKTEIEVEEVLGYSNLDSKIITAKVLSVQPHGNADKLALATVSDGSHKYSIVCGAPNLRVNQMVALAKPGAVLPNGMKIVKTVIRGEKSEGMLCSPSELAVSDDHSGIDVLDPDLPCGISLCDIENLNDIIDIKTPTNRPDYLSFIGIAREICAFVPNASLKEPKYSDIEFTKQTRVDVKEIGESKRFVSVIFTIDKKSTSPSWLVDNLKAAGIRAINPAVDITNYVMLETGQPSHAYDFEKLNGNMQVRFAKKGEGLSTLDGSSHTLSSKDLVIADNKGPIALAGVMGGESTQVDDTTTKVLLEVAHFDKTTVRRAALRHGLRTEASSRFEKGLPLPLSIYATKRLMYLFETICGAKIIEPACDQLYSWPWVQHIGMRVRKAEAFLGIKLDEKQVIAGLRDRGFEAEHFSLTKEAKKHLGKPYILGASFKKNGIDAFDCSYFVQYIYDLIGISLRPTVKDQFEYGDKVEIDSLKPGDVLFLSGTVDEFDGDAKLAKDRDYIRHNGIYVGGGKIIHAKGGTVRKVEITDLSSYIKSKKYLGARRYVESFNHIIAITAPWWRDDVRIEQDIYEEVVKIVGYENVPTTLPQLPPTPTAKHQMVLQLQSLREQLVANGLFDIVSYSFVSAKQLQDVGYSHDVHLKILNPLTIEQEYLRTDLMMSHLKVVGSNRLYYKESYVFFELSRVYGKSSKNDGREEKWQLAVTAVGKNSIDVLRGILTLINTKYRLDTTVKADNTHTYFIPGRSASVVANKKNIGKIGQLSPAILKMQKINKEVSFMCVDIGDYISCLATSTINEPRKYQLISRDFTLQLLTDIWWSDISSLYPQAKNVQYMEYISEFSSEDLQSQRLKRLSFRVWFDCGAQPKEAHIKQNTNDFMKLLRKHLKNNFEIV